MRATVELYMARERIGGAAPETSERYLTPKP
jgi:hypothetical protein